MKTLILSDNEYEALKDRLQVLMDQAKGVDIWLAPGGTLDVNEQDAQAECYLDCDEEAHFRLGSILAKMLGSFHAHQDWPVPLGLSDEEVAAERKGHRPLWVVFQRGENDQPESRPITGIYSTREKAIAAAVNYLLAVDGRVQEPTVDEGEITWKFGENDKFECVASDAALDN